TSFCVNKTFLNLSVVGICGVTLTTLPPLRQCVYALPAQIRKAVPVLANLPNCTTRLFRRESCGYNNTRPNRPVHPIFLGVTWQNSRLPLLCVLPPLFVRLLVASGKMGYILSSKTVLADDTLLCLTFFLHS